MGLRDRGVWVSATAYGSPPSSAQFSSWASLPAGADVSVVAQDPPGPVCPPGLFADKRGIPRELFKLDHDGGCGGAGAPTGFTESIVFSGLTNPINIEFAADGRVFVAEKSGIIKVYDNLSDTRPPASAPFRQTSTTTGTVACSGWHSIRA